MIDVHRHILPALDDGAHDLEDALGMAREACGEGVLTVCATPHIRHDHEVVIGELGGRVAALRTELHLRDEELATVSLGGGLRWILVEPAPGPIGPSLARAVDDLRRRGFRSVIAHPERHSHSDSHSSRGGPPFRVAT